MKLLATLWCFLAFSNLWAQVSTEKRIEINAAQLYSYDVFGLGEEGLVVESMGFEKGRYKFYYQKYDSNLVMLEKKDQLIDKGLPFSQNYHTENKVYSLFHRQKGDYTLLELDAKTFTLNSHKGVIPKNSYIYDMVVSGDFAYLSARIQQKPFLIVINVRNGQNQVVPIEFTGYKPKNITIANVQAIPETSELIVFAKLIDSRKSSETFIIRFNEKGEKASEGVLAKKADQNVVSISANYLSPGRYTFVGTYSTKSTTASEGLFYCQTTDDRVDVFSTINFLDLQDFHSHLKTLKKWGFLFKQNRKAKTGKELKVSYQIASHNVMETEEGYLFLGEAYYPVYAEDSYSSSGQIVYRQKLIGYQYTHAILCKFDREGELIWDRSFTMAPLTNPVKIKRFISLVESEDAVLKMIFTSGEKIITKAVDKDGNTVLDSESDEIFTGNESDRIKTSTSNLEYWYDNYYYAFGFQKIKNSNDDMKRKRKVYFINKVRF